jgi:hypothetical protein
MLNRSGALAAGGWAEPDPGPGAVWAKAAGAVDTIAADTTTATPPNSPRREIVRMRQGSPGALADGICRK